MGSPSYIMTIAMAGSLVPRYVKRLPVMVETPGILGGSAKTNRRSGDPGDIWQVGSPPIQWVIPCLSHGYPMYKWFIVPASPFSLRTSIVDKVGWSSWFEKRTWGVWPEFGPANLGDATKNMWDLVCSFITEYIEYMMVDGLTINDAW